LAVIWQVHLWGLYPIYTIEQTSSKHQPGLIEPRSLDQV